MSRKPRDKRRWGFLGVLVAAPVFLAACSSLGSPSASSGATSTTAQTANPLAAAPAPNSAAASSTPTGSNAVAVQIDSLAAQCVAEINQASTAASPVATCSSQANDNISPASNGTGAAAGELCQKLKSKSVPAALGSFSAGQIGDPDALSSTGYGPVLECSWNLSSDRSQLFYFSITDIRAETPAQQASYTSGTTPGSVTQNFPDGSTSELELGTLGFSFDPSDDLYYRDWPDHWDIKIEVDNGQIGDTIWTKAAPQISAELHSAVTS